MQNGDIRGLRLNARERAHLHALRTAEELGRGHAWHELAVDDLARFAQALRERYGRAPR